ncbi:L-arabinonate dehydratase [Ochrobactrum sp. C6C9]|uniref:L-arabinonate dehydratase n=1 Tax=Ochrobactrum sp. C6C9 TaxID=2736662 RepID=UPI0035303DF3
MVTRKTYEELRSAKWFTPADKGGHTHRERIKQAGFSDKDFRGKPVIGVFSSWSELNPCHIHFRERAEDVKRGIWQAGGFPLEVPVMSLGEPFMRPTTMLYRDLLSIEIEEVIRCHPVDGAVLMGGCDKTTPAMLMGAISTNLPAIFLPAGPMLTGRWRGKTLGSGTDVSRYYAELQAGNITREQYTDMESAGARSAGHCMTMGTASTMTSIAEVLGMTLPGASSIPAPDSRHRHMAADVGRTIVDMVWEDRKPRDILDERSFHNAVTALMALGGSTNAIIHLLALADRVGVKLALKDFDRLSETVPVIANIKPSGQYLMEEFYYAGGLPALLSRISECLELDAATVNGKSLGANIAGAECFDDDVIRPLDAPLTEAGGLAVLYGNLAPDGCVLKRSAADPKLMKHRGKAVVFKDRDDLAARINAPDLDVDADSILVLQNAGLKGVPGMPEWGMLPIPEKLVRQGVRDMVRISDARMSGTHYGTVLLHVSPESAVGGPLALVETGDVIDLDVEARSISLLVEPAKLEHRRSLWSERASPHLRGWSYIYSRHVTSASQGASLDFLRGDAEMVEPKF